MAASICDSMRCIVIGSGIAGLTTGLLLARLGHAVTIIEAAPRPAPLLQGFVRDGLYFETGFHCGGGLHPGGILWHWLEALGLLDGKDALRDIRLDNRDVFHFADGLHAYLPSGCDAITQSITSQFPGHEIAMRDFMEDTFKILGHSPYLDASVAGAPSPLTNEGLSLLDKLGSSALPAPLQSMIASRCLLYGTLPHDAAFDDFSLVAGPYFQSSGTWQGGGRELSRIMTARLDALGVEIQCGQAVAGIEADSTGVHGVTLANGQSLQCDYCFFTGHPRQLGELLPSGMLRPAFRHRIAQMPEGISAMLLFGEVKNALRSGESIYLLPESNLTPAFPSIEEDCPTIYIFCDREQQNGRKSVMVVARVDTDAMERKIAEDGYAVWKQATANRIRRYVEKRLPWLRDNWRILEVATPHTMRRYLHGCQGSLYGLRHSIHDIPLLPMTRVNRLFLAGQNIILAGILGAIVSAAVAVGSAFGHDSVLKEFRKCAHGG